MAGPDMDDVPLSYMTRPATNPAPGRGRPGWLVHVAAVAWTAGIAVLLTSSLPSPGGELSFAVQLALELDLDKLIHAGLVAVHALLLAPSFARLGRRAGDVVVGAVLTRPRAWAWVAACLWSMSFELVQATLPARAASLGDALADLAGGVAVALWWRWRAGRTR